jgi:hypothetical protein
MSRRSSALVFAVLWTGAMPWTSLSADAGAVVVPIVPIALMLSGALAGLVCYWLSGPTCADSDAPPARPGERLGPPGPPYCGLSRPTHS